MGTQPGTASGAPAADASDQPHPEPRDRPHDSRSRDGAAGVSARERQRATPAGASVAQSGDGNTTADIKDGAALSGSQDAPELGQNDASAPGMAVSAAIQPGASPSAALPDARGFAAAEAGSTAQMADSPASTKPEPAEQVAASLAGLSGSGAGAGAQQLTLHLRPTELGLVQIRIARAHDMPARVDIMVHEPRTLNLLLRDQERLAHTLDQAGIPRDGRVLNIHLAPVDMAGTAPDLSGRSSGGGGQPGMNAGHSDSGGGSSRNGGESRSRGGSVFATTAAGSASQWARAGLDITA